ncbi:MAG: hypothetical protein JWR38_2859 [Mucilaginibacter sp.]|nr:hypothetical protein [Mucilaginibacter sp.]
MTQLIIDDIEAASVDLIVIPHSTVATLSDSFSEIVKKFELIDVVPQAELGDMTILPISSHSKWRYVAFACSVSGNTSSYTAIYQIIIRLASQLPTDVSTIAIPLLGTGAGNLDPEKVYHVISRSFDQILPTTSVTVYTIDEEINKRILPNIKKVLSIDAVKLVFDYVVEDIVKVRWVKEMMQSDDFYFSYAREKFNEYITWYSQDVDFAGLLEQFNSSKLVFSKFLETIEKDTQAYRFLILCGELVAYIDRHAYNKKIWNRYTDKRTMALSSVNQTRWIQNLINFRAHFNENEVLTPSIRNAFLYLKQPAENLTMLSVNHRFKIAEVLFNNVEEADLLSAVGKYFKERQILCKNPDNNGILYSRILYAPDIKALWIDEPANQQPRFKSILTKIQPKTTQENKDVEEQVAENIRQRNLKTLMHSDLYASVDLLNYETYASIIARLITSNLSRPPFNISIMAPWGKGKTSLMRFIQKKIHAEDPIRQVIKERPISSIQTLLGWINSTETLFDSFKKLDYPVIWFNAWKFQKSEQVWAGLADEIIRQLSLQLDSVNRERFWLKLNVKRIDRDKLKNELLFKLMGKFILPLIYAIVGLGFSWLFTNIPWGRMLAANSTVMPSLINGLPITVGIAAAFYKIFKDYKKPPELEIGKFVLQPEYRQKMGYLQAVEDDLRQAIEIVINPDKPAIIFIDDLDRCSPMVIVDVVEAINAFMSGDLSNCYFITGQDPQMVIASLDTAYDKIAGKIGKLESQHSSIGRFFLEKFSQLSLNIPTMHNEQKQEFIETLLATIDIENIPDDDAQKDLLEEYRQFEVELDTLADPEDIFNPEKDRLEKQIRLFNTKAVSVFQEKILSSAFKTYHMDDNELENLVIDVAEYLDSPRTIKRFLNLFLFYHFFRFTIPGRKLAEIDEQTLGRWLVVMVRWPLLVQAVQWDTEKGFVSGASALERANRFDELIAKATDYISYCDILKEKAKGDSVWLIDPELFNICKESRTAVRLSAIVAAGIW